MARLVLTPFGRPALEALSAVVTEAQGDDPLAPVTVVVPSAPAAVSVRRALGRRSPTGVANVRTLALPQLAVLLATPLASSDGRHPVSVTWSAALVRAGLADARPPLSGVPASAAVEEALTLTFARLREASDAELRALETRSDRAAAVIDRYRAHRDALAGHLDRHDLLLLAASSVRSDPEAAAELGPVVLHLPRRLGRADLDLVAALAGGTEVVAVLGMTGDEDADRPSRRLREQLTEVFGPLDAASPSVSPPVPARVVLAPDPDEEAREAVRLVLARLEVDPIDLDRVALLSRVESPYRLLLHEHLTAAGLPHHVDLPWSVAQSMPGRVLLGLLDLPDHGFRRVDVARWLRAGPIRWKGRAVPVPEWDSVARRAGIVQGLDQWQSRLDSRAADITDQLAAGWIDEEQATGRIEPVRGLQAFVAELGRNLPPGARRSWQDWVAWGHEALERHLGASGNASDWPADDQADLQRVKDRLDGLAGLDGIEAAPDAAGFRRVLGEELGRLRRRVGRLGQGIQVGDLESAHGLDLDLVVILGMAEGWYPPRHRDDPLLPDHEVSDAGLGDALGWPDRADERRDHLAARAAGAEVVLLAPRSDPRGQRELQPARWLLEEVARHLGHPVAVAEVAAVDGPWLARSPSFEDTVRLLPVALDRSERDLAALLRSTVAGTPSVAEHPVARSDPRLARGLEAVASRRDRIYNEWTGRVGARDALVFHDETMASATRLERFARCPFQYLLGNVLNVRAHEDPVDEEGITPRDRGSLVHEVLETFFIETLGRDPDEGWAEADRRRLHEILGQVGEDYRARGLTGRELGWTLQSSAMQRWLGALLDRDAEERSARQVRPVAAELRFGDDTEHPPAEVALPDGRRLLFRGAVDRIDQAADGSLVVIDYKTGKGASYSTVDKDRLDRGRKLQLPLYADAARRSLGTPEAEVEAYYWFVEDSGKKAWRGGPIDPPVQERFEEVVATLVDGIETGAFPANPGQEGFFGPTNCGFCDFQRVCPSSRVDQWEGVREDPALERYVDLAEGERP